jgi:asparagine N-glycosylation enzyme membrane subunit Stt3
MTTESSNKTPIWFWIVSAIALLWNAMGVVQYLQQAYETDSFKEMSTPEQLEMYANLPSWYIAAFALAVFGGVIGCILLLLRKKLAYKVFLISFIAIIVQMSYVTFSLNMANAMTAMIVVVGGLLLWLSKSATKKGWLH